MYLFHYNALDFTPNLDKVDIRTVSTSAFYSKLCVNKSYNQMRDIAKQVLAVLLSDRLFKSELSYFCPTVYGLTGYSFMTQQASNILKDVRRECKNHGPNAVAETFEEAFYKLVVRG